MMTELYGRPVGMEQLVCVRRTFRYVPSKPVIKMEVNSRPSDRERQPA